MYKSNITRQRIIEIAAKKGMTQKELLEKCELNKMYMQNLKEKVIKADNLIKIADELEVSTDYLLGRTDNPKINK